MFLRANVYRQMVEYDACSRVVKRREAVGGTYTRYDTGYTYDIENRPTEIAHGDTVKSVYDYGKLDRVESVTLKRGTTEFKKNFTYQAGGYGGASTTATVEKIEQPGHAYQYTVRGGLTAERHNGVKTTYEYDGLGQLKRVNDEGRGTSTAYTYDQGGNILSRVEYPYAARGRKLGEASRTVAYAYGDDGWKDVLTAYDGVAIESDAIGNVVDDGTWRYTWRMGRQLLRMASPAEYIWYAYDADGLRVRKESESRGVTEYTLSDGRVVHQRRGTQEMHFWYGSRRNPVMATYNGKDYGYVYNRQGDVIALVDVENGFAEVVTYAYDAWGKLLSCTGTMAETLGRENPFRYRGYVYDEETGLYYLKSRYYNPEWGRFLSADSVMGSAGTLMGHNLFAYCFNNPVGMSDRDGRYPKADDDYTVKDYWRDTKNVPNAWKGSMTDDRPSSSVNYLPVEEDAPKSNGSSDFSGSNQVIRIGDKITTSKVATATGMATPQKAMLQGLANTFRRGFANVPSKKPGMYNFDMGKFIDAFFDKTQKIMDEQQEAINEAHVIIGGMKGLIREQQDEIARWKGMPSLEEIDAAIKKGRNRNFSGHVGYVLGAVASNSLDYLIGVRDAILSVGRSFYAEATPGVGFEKSIGAVLPGIEAPLKIGAGLKYEFFTIGMKDGHANMKPGGIKAEVSTGILEDGLFGSEFGSKYTGTVDGSLKAEKKNTLGFSISDYGQYGGYGYTLGLYVDLEKLSYAIHGLLAALGDF